MSLDSRAREAAQGLRSATVVDPDAGLRRLLRTHRRRNAGRLAGVGVAAALVFLVAGTGLTGQGNDAGPVPAAPPSNTPSGTPSPSPSTKPIDTTRWSTYTSDQYGFTVGHPRGWSEIPATRDWQFARDVRVVANKGQDTFLAPSGELAVSVWNAPLERGTRIDSTADIEAWVANYCNESGGAPCSGIDDRAVALCLEARDCHPGVLVSFDTDVQAFFSGGIYESDAMTVVEVWRGDDHFSAAPYGGAKRLLEGFLSTMAVWPASTPFVERVCYGGPPRALSCERTS